MRIKFIEGKDRSKRLHKSGEAKNIFNKRYKKELIKAHYSHVLDRKVTVEVLFPAEMEATDKHYPLLILNDGQDNKTVRIKKCLERMVQLGELPKIIVAGVYAHNRINEYGVSERPDYKGRGGLASKYAEFIVVELINFLKYKYPINDGPHTIAGYSLGGLSALDIAWSYPENFDRVGVFSGALWWRSKDAADKKFDEQKHRIMHQQIRKSSQKPDIKFWFQTGTLDEHNDRNHNGVIDSIDDTLDLITELNKKGYRPFVDVEYLEVIGGKHNQETWSKAMPYFLRWAFGG